MGEIPMPNFDSYTLPGTTRQPVKDAYREIGQVLRGNQPHPCLISSLAFVCGREVSSQARALPLEDLTVQNLVTRYLSALPGAMTPQRVFFTNSEVDEKIQRALGVKYAHDRFNRVLAPGFLSVVYSDFDERLTKEEIDRRLHPQGSQVSDLAKSFSSHVVGAIQMPDRPGTYLTWDTSRRQAFEQPLNTRQMLTWLKDFGSIEQYGYKTPVPMAKAYLVPFNFLS
jgi:hypothetical protein